MSFKVLYRRASLGIGVKLDWKSKEVRDMAKKTKASFGYPESEWLKETESQDD